MDALLLSKYLYIYMTRESLYRQNKNQLFSVVVGKWTEAMKEKIEADSQYELLGLNGNVVGLFFSHQNHRLRLWSTALPIYGFALGAKKLLFILSTGPCEQLYLSRILHQHVWCGWKLWREHRKLKCPCRVCPKEGRNYSSGRNQQRTCWSQEDFSGIIWCHLFSLWC